MHELINHPDSLFHWNEALKLGKDLLRSSRRRDPSVVLGALFAMAGYSLIKKRFQTPPFLVASERRIKTLRRLMSDTERENWGVAFPDGMVWQVTPVDDQPTAELYAIVEYKVANPRHLYRMQEQLVGFENLVRFLRNENRTRVGFLMRDSLSKSVPRWVVPDTIQFIYVTPLGRDASLIPTNLQARDSFQELQLALSVPHMRRIIEARRSNT